MQDSSDFKIFLPRLCLISTWSISNPSTSNRPALWYYNTRPKTLSVTRGETYETGLGAIIHSDHSVIVSRAADRRDEEARTDRSRFPPASQAHGERLRLRDDTRAVSRCEVRHQQFDRYFQRGNPRCGRTGQPGRYGAPYRRD